MDLADAEDMVGTRGRGRQVEEMVVGRQAESGEMMSFELLVRARPGKAYDPFLRSKTSQLLAPSCRYTLKHDSTLDERKKRAEANLFTWSSPLVTFSF